MSSDRTLSEFLDQATPSDHDTPATDDEMVETDSVMEFSPSGAVCARCRDTTRRRWREGNQFVCQSCKSW